MLQLVNGALRKQYVVVRDDEVLVAAVNELTECQIPETG
jgi:hypothetical protein